MCTNPHISPDFSRSGLSFEPSGNIRSVGNTVGIPLLREKSAWSGFSLKPRRGEAQGCAEQFPCELKVRRQLRENR